jgi:hypothetical protein
MSTEFVIATCGNIEEVAWLQKLCDSKGYSIKVYDKCGSCNGIKNCTALENKGREQDTWLNYIISNYSNLTDRVVFLPTPIEKYMPRRYCLMSALEGKNSLEFNPEILGEWENFTITEWGGNVVTPPASIRPFRKWYEYHFGTWDPNKRFAFNGACITTRERILRTSLSKFQELREETRHDENPEAGHYLERAMNTLY